MKTYPIPAPLMQDIINVLQALPWGQVNGVMNNLVPLIREVDDQRGNGKEKVDAEATSHLS